MVLGTMIEGEAREVGVCMAGIARGALERGAPIVPPCALISGGETTVTIEGPAGLGGPNQEFVLAFASKMGARGPYACASVDTDGTDGPTDLAGGLVDATTMVRARELGIDIAEALRGHASADALTALGDACAHRAYGHEPSKPAGDPIGRPPAVRRRERRKTMAGRIELVEAREILGASGRPTVEATVVVEGGVRATALGAERNVQG